jgi:two-component system LytT family response regulator
MKSELDGRIGPHRLSQQAAAHDHALVEPVKSLPAVARREPADSAEETRRSKYLAVRSVRKITFLKIADIAWVDALHNYVRLHAADGKTLVAREQICDIEKRLACEGFLRVHRSTIINVDFVREVEITESGSYVVIMISGQRLAVSRSYHATLFALIDSL